jgi:hypothetical protein
VFQIFVPRDALCGARGTGALRMTLAARRGDAVVTRLFTPDSRTGRAPLRKDEILQ